GASAQLPIGLRGLDIPHCAGRGVCGGIGIGAAVIVSGLSLPRALRDAKPKSQSHERDAALHALSSLGAALRPRAARPIALDADSIVLADTLTAGQLLAMDRARLKGLALGSVGATAHTVILARSLCIPTVLDARAALTLARPGEPLVLDGDGGFVLHGGH